MKQRELVQREEEEKVEQEEEVAFVEKRREAHCKESGDQTW